MSDPLDVFNTVLDVDELRQRGMTEQADIDMMLELMKIALDAKRNKAIGRYQGWGLVGKGNLTRWLEMHREFVKQYMSILRWESLSYDTDDHGDWAVSVKRFGPLI